MKRRAGAMLVALLTAMMVVAVTKPAAADPGYIDCMNHAITHKYALIDAGWSYSDAHSHYLGHTQQCYEFFYGNQ